VLAWLRQVTTETASLSCWCQGEQACYQLRLIALRLSPQASARRQAYKREKACDQPGGRSRPWRWNEQAGFWWPRPDPKPVGLPRRFCACSGRDGTLNCFSNGSNRGSRLVPVRGHTVETVVATIRAVLVAWALRAVRKPASCARCCEPLQTHQADALSCWQELTCHGPLEREQCDQEPEEPEQDGQGAAREQVEPAARVREAAGALSRPPSQEQSLREPEQQVSVAGLHPATSWEAITADWHPSGGPSPDTLQPVSRLSAERHLLADPARACTRHLDAGP
jgi:hypothetical protein